MNITTFSHSGVLSSELNLTANKIDSFSNLKAGWRYGAGLDFSKRVLNTGKSINAQFIFSGFFQTDAFPGKNGDVVIVAYDGDDHYEFRVNKDNSIIFIHEQMDDELIERKDLDLQSAIAQIQILKDLKWTAFFTSTFAITMKDSVDLEAKRLNPPAMEAVYLLSPDSASWIPQDAHAYMEKFFINPLYINQSSFGNLTLHSYSVDAFLNKKTVKREIPAITT